MRGYRSVSHPRGRLLLAALFIILVPLAARASNSNPSLIGGPGHPLLPLKSPGTFAAAAPAAGAHLTYYGGRVVSNLKVVQVLYGTGSYLSNVSSTGSPSVATFYQGVLNSPYVDWLTEYNTNITAAGGGAGTNQSIGRGSFVGQVLITPSAGNSGSTISDSQIQNELAAQITAGFLPAPTNDAGGNNNTYYAVFFPHGITITSGGESSCVGGGFCAYHGTISNVGGHEIYYGVHPDMQTGSGCDSGCGGGTTFQNCTSVASHEMVETITDAEVGIAPNLAPPLAWYDSSNGEIGDICNAQQGSVVGADGVTYTVQTEWSNIANACVVTGPGTPTPTATRTRTLTPTNTPTPTITPTATNTPVATPTASISISGGPTYNPPGGGSCTVSGTPCLTGGATVSCSGLNPSAVRVLYFGIRNDQSVNGHSMTGAAPAVGSPAVFRFGGSTSNSLIYVSSTTVFDAVAGTNQSVSSQLVLTLTSGTASIVATGGNPPDNGNGDVGYLWNVSSNNFTVTVNLQARDAAFPSFGNSCPTLFDPTRTRNGIDNDSSHVDLGFYFETLPTPTNTLTPAPTITNTPASSPTMTATPTNTPTATDTATLTPTKTPTASPTRTPTNTPSLTPTNTPTQSPTNTPTGTLTSTVTLTQTLTATPGGTLTETSTATPTPTSTQTATETPTPTPAVTSTPIATATATPTVTVTPLTRDSVVLPPRPRNYTIPAGKTSVTKKLRVKVVNADILPITELGGHPIQLSVGSTDCPAGMVGTPDFGRAALGPSNVVIVLAGRTKTAIVPLTINGNDFATFNHKAPTRCTLTFTASAPDSLDPTPENAVATVEINIIDRNDTPEGTARHESLIASIAPVKVTLPNNSATKIKVLKPTVVNADILPTVETTADAITVTATDGDCPSGTVGIADYDTSTVGAQNTALLTGGQSMSGALSLTINASAFLSPNAKSPARCTAVLTAIGPDGDTDSSNNTTKLVIDVIDNNDF